MSKPRKRKQRPHRRPGQSRRAELAAHEPPVGLMLRADEAERRGDALGALEVMESAPYDASGRWFWRPWRAERLLQIAVLGPRLPGWATSRWILEQAAQDLDSRRRRLHLQAIATAIEVRGGVENVGQPTGEDPEIMVLDTDWVHRQLRLYEYGGLLHFVRRRATPDLVAGADRIEEWARQPMGGFRYLDRSPEETGWEDLATGSRFRIPNIGSAALLLPGECVIARLVPIEDGQLFEAVPLRVAEATALDVAADPPGWVDALRRQRDRGAPVESGGHRFGIVSDVPRAVSMVTVYDDLPFTASDADRARCLLQTAARVLAGDRPGAERGAEQVDVWPCLANELLAPDVMAGLVDVVTADDADVLGALADQLVEPAAAVCRELAAEARRAA